MRRWWHPEAFAARRANLIRRGRAVAAIRRFFEERDFLEVETPCLQVSPGLEPHLKAFSTRLEEPFTGDVAELWLHTSPEFAMKKLLVAGMPRLFQMARCFRNGERSATHHPEFVMLEWYRAGAAYTDLMDDCEGLLRAVAEATGAREFRRGDAICDPFRPWRRQSVADAFREYCGIDLLATARPAESPAPALLAAEARRLDIAPGATDTWEDLFFRIFLDRIEPHLGNGVPTLLYDYPISMAALSRPKPDDPRLAERFELYVAGLELANAFGELTDAAQQRCRFVADMDRKEGLYGVRYPIDEDFLAALAWGMPESAGIALGVDRLVMLACGAESLDEVLWAPVAG
ncbi:MAG: EF-P lysine aminoacylase EpmA [Magnetospirillum sp. WYHS-4]